MSRYALRDHATAVDAVLAENFENWPIGESMTLIAMLAREVAAAEKARRDLQKSEQK